MSKSNFADELISYNDMKVVRELAEKYNMIAVAIRNSKEEIELMNIAIMYSIKISTLIRYCSLHYDGNSVMS